MIFWLWYIAVSFGKWNRPESRARILFDLACSTPALCLLWLYFRGYASPLHGPLGGPWAALRTAAQCVAMSLGQGRSDTLALVDHRRPELPGRGGCHAGKSLVCRARRTDAHRGSGVYPGRRVSDGIGVGLGTVGTR